jgi:hypothetical protein
MRRTMGLTFADIGQGGGALSGIFRGARLSHTITNAEDKSARGTQAFGVTRTTSRGSRGDNTRLL